jgi:signal transduction histidine kinase
MDPAAFDIILDNLVENAVSFARTRVTVSVGLDGSGSRAVVAVEDDGHGMPPEHLGRVFDRFFTWRPGEDRGRHTGLGLSLALALARAEGGEITAANGSGGGGRFMLSVPIGPTR